jgi:hypothetical protein
LLKNYLFKILARMERSMTVTIKKEIPKLNITVKFTPRSMTTPRGAFKKFQSPHNMPVTSLPVDSTGNATVKCPMDGNDSEGDCGEAMIAHVDNIWTYGQGKPGYTESVFDVNNLVSQYLKISGGDNGMDEAMLVGSGGVWRTGIAGNPAAVVVDALDIDLTDVPTVQYAIDQFYTVQMAWSVPDAFLNGFDTGTVWATAGIPDPNNGHYTPLASVRSGSYTPPAGATVNVTGFYELWTWGAWCLVSPAFVSSVQPQGFVAFSARQFSPSTGLDSKGRHIVIQAAKWQAFGGNAIPASVINAFPPLVGPTPTPGPTPVPTPSNTIQQQIDALFVTFESHFSKMPKILAGIKALQAKIDALFAQASQSVKAEQKLSPAILQLINAAIAAAEAAEPQYAREIAAFGSVLNTLLPLLF